VQVKQGEVLGIKVLMEATLLLLAHQSLKVRLEQELIPSSHMAVAVAGVEALIPEEITEVLAVVAVV
jgi:hypothetical protein